VRWVVAGINLLAPATYTSRSVGQIPGSTTKVFVRMTLFFGLWFDVVLFLCLVCCWVVLIFNVVVLILAFRHLAFIEDQKPCFFYLHPRQVL
jgi:hypothetical protein